MKPVKLIRTLVSCAKCCTQIYLVASAYLVIAMDFLNTIKETDKWLVVRLVVAMLNREPNANLISALRGRWQFNTEAVAQAASAFDETVRSVFDQWIDSGKSGPDMVVDTPRDRDVNAIPPGWQRPLFDILAEWLGRNMRPLALQRNGRLAVIYPQANIANINDSPSLVGRDFAIGWFIQALDSPECYRVARCSNFVCRRYFVYSRTPNGSIKNGTFCEKCKGYASVRRTQSTRVRRINDMIGFAADVWEQWKPNSGQGPRSKWVAKKVGKRMKRNQAKTGGKLAAHFTGENGRWVTTHQDEIEAEVQRRQHATRKN